MDLSTTLLVLKKTKLGETDLIITGFSEEGVQVRAVAKGARRPGSKIGVHLELFSIARVLLHEGRNLGIVREAHTVISNEACRKDVMHSAGAAVIVELLDRVSADGDCEARLFPLAIEALRCLGAAPEEGIKLIAAATVLKIAAQLGYRPSLRECVLCGSLLEREKAPASAHAGISFSFDQGGVICEDCLPELPEFTHQGYAAIDAQIIEWAEVLITSRFVSIEAYADGEHEAVGHLLLEFAREWARFHLVKRLKSLDFLLDFR